MHSDNSKSHQYKPFLFAIFFLHIYEHWTVFEYLKCVDLQSVVWSNPVKPHCCFICECVVYICAGGGGGRDEVGLLQTFEHQRQFRQHLTPVPIHYITYITELRSSFHSFFFFWFSFVISALLLATTWAIWANCIQHCTLTYYIAISQKERWGKDGTSESEMLKCYKFSAFTSTVGKNIMPQMSKLCTSTNKNKNNVEKELHVVLRLVFVCVVFCCCYFCCWTTMQPGLYFISHLSL